MLGENNYLLANQISLADIAVFPFIRQFSLVDKNGFEQSPHVHVKQWLNHLINTKLFQHVFQKHEIWKTGNTIVYI
jgi:glutathione S-transferase